MAGRRGLTSMVPGTDWMVPIVQAQRIAAIRARGGGTLHPGLVDPHGRAPSAGTISGVERAQAMAMGLGGNRGAGLNSSWDPRGWDLGNVGDIISGGVEWAREQFGDDPGTNGTCIPPWRIDPASGDCKLFLGQQEGSDEGGDAVRGGFNMPAFTPDVVGEIEKKDGTMSAIRRCPKGTVLATDNLCYAKGTAGLAAHRKWKPGTKPFLSGGDVRCLRRANTLKHSKGSKAILRELGMGK